MEMEHCGPESVSDVSIEKNWKVSGFAGLSIHSSALQ